MTVPSERCLLLVEDDTLVRDTVSAMLEDEGFEVVEAANAAQALSLMRAGLDAPIIVTDVDLGSGLNGAQLVDLLRRLRPDLRIIFITGRMGSLGNRQSDPHEAVLHKPFASDALSTLIRKMSSSH